VVEFLCSSPPPDSVIGKIVGDDLQGIEEIVQILDFGHRTQAAQRHANGLAHDGGFPDPCIGNPVDPVLFLQMSPALVYSAEMPHVFAERNKMRLAMAERTRLSGNRAVPFKTTFPALLRLVLNETLLYPFHVLQKLSARNERSLVVYAEFATPI